MPTARPTMTALCRQYPAQAGLLARCAAAGFPEAAIRRRVVKAASAGEPERRRWNEFLYKLAAGVTAPGVPAISGTAAPRRAARAGHELQHRRGPGRPGPALNHPASPAADPALAPPVDDCNIFQHDLGAIGELSGQTHNTPRGAAYSIRAASVQSASWQSSDQY